MTKTALAPLAVLLVVAATAAPPSTNVVPAEPAAAAAPGAPAQDASVFESPEAPAAVHPIDRIVFAKLAKSGIQPVLCSDAVFVRRAFIDVTGTLPTAQEARDFIRDPDAKNKRARLIDRLLEREEYADYWAMKWGDILRIKAEFPVNLWPNAAQAYHRWVRAAVAQNMPYDRFVRELLTSSGSNFRVGPVNFYRAIQNRTPDGIAAAVALAFMGVRVDSLPKDRAAGMAAFFSQVGYKPTSEWKEEVVFWDPVGETAVPDNAAPGRAAIAPSGTATNTNATAVATLTLPTNVPPREAVFPDGAKIRLRPGVDPRETFADWLISRKNPWFNRAIANRVWYWLMGRGIIHEPDDIRPDNPPSHPELLALLERELVAGRYDLKRLYRLILNSQTYQLSCVPHAKSAEAEKVFGRYPVRRLDAEVLIDAINQVTGATDLYTSPIPEPFTFIPEGKPAVTLPDGSITSPFLALFGRSARATGMENERDNKPVPSQWLYLLNSTEIQRKIEQGPRLKALFESGRKPQEIAEELYLTVLSRLPTEAELQALRDQGCFAGPGSKPPSGAQRQRENWNDATWALMNSFEFLYRH